MIDVTNAQRRSVLEEIRYYRDAECLHNEDALALLAAYEEDTCPIYSPVVLTGEEVKALDERCKTLFSADVGETKGLRQEIEKIIARSKGEA